MKSALSLCNPPVLQLLLVRDVARHWQKKQLSFQCNLMRSPGDLPNPGIEPRSPALQVDSLPAKPPGSVTNSPGFHGLEQQPFILRLYLLTPS